MPGPSPTRDFRAEGEAAADAYIADTSNPRGGSRPSLTLNNGARERFVDAYAQIARVGEANSRAALERVAVEYQDAPAAVAMLRRAA